MNQAIIIASIGVVIFLMWITLYLSDIHEEISEIRKLLSSTPIAQKSKSSKNIGNSQNDIKEDPKGKWGDKLKEPDNYDIAKD